MSGEQLERRYRGLLRILPKSYRAAREEELLSALMDGAAEGRRWPELREALSLARLGMRVRLGSAVDGGSPASTRAGEMVRAVAIAGTALLAFMGLAQLAMYLAPVRDSPFAYWDWTDPTVVKYAPNYQRSIFEAEVPALWLLVLALITVGWWRAARTLALGVFLVSLSLSDGTERVLQEEVLLAGIVTAALFAVRGVRARPVVVPGIVSMLTAAGVAFWYYKGHREPLMKAFWALQALGTTENRHAMVLAALGAAAVGIMAYRSAVWPVALAVVAVAALVPVFIRAAARPVYGGGDQIPLAFLGCALVLVAGLAVLKEWRSGRSGRSGRPELPVSTS
ncbi:hypothetical protein ABH926_008068 [Catenulispora sp. GP43]|uniref:hypothetical protein n=1 Tax=Catenulispora sp. GP43 TaxID=3156263 RepID=UPI003513CB0C